MTLEQLDLFYHESYLVQSTHSEEGVVFTPIDQAEKLLRPIFNRLSKKGVIRILEPSSGTGNLTIATIRLLSSKKISPKRVEIVSCELNTDYIALQKQFIKEHYPEWYKSISFKNRDFLFSFNDKNEFDYVVMNPPWVGYKNIPSAQRNRIKLAYNLSGQFDLLDPFVLKAFELTKIDGRLGLFLPDKVISSHQPSNSLDIIKHSCSTFKSSDLPSTFFDGVQHESVFVNLKKSSSQLSLPSTTKRIKPEATVGDYFQLFRGFELSGRSSEYIVGSQSRALDPSRRFISGQEICEDGSISEKTNRYIGKNIPKKLIKSHFDYNGPAILIRKTGSPVRVAYVDKLPHVSQVVFVVIPKVQSRKSKEALKKLTEFLQSEDGQQLLCNNSGKLGRSLFPYITLSDIKAVELNSNITSLLSSKEAA